MACKRRVLRTSAVLFFLLVRVFSISARMRADIGTAGPSFSGLAKITALPTLEQCTHKTGRLWFSVTNYGVLGNQKNVFLRDCLTGGVTSSAEYPGGSGVEYLFQGALWVGGIVGRDTLTQDTLTSIGNDGWAGIREIFPEAGASGTILRRSANLSSPYYSPEAVSDLDFIATYYDTLKDPRLVTSIDPDDGKPHKPLGLKVVQKSYSWSSGWGQDWVLLDYTLTNIGNERIRRAYAGLFIDPDIGNINSGRATHIDDYCGFRAQVVLDTCQVNIENLNIAYAYDNDGDPEAGEDFGLSTNKPTAALGVRVLRAGQALRPDGTLNTGLAFNWWVPDSLATLDWGPQKRPGRASFFGGRGQPLGDAMRYYYLSNREIDYDQIQSAIPQSVINPGPGSEWLPPLASPISAIDLANGADSRFLLSAGPFDLDVGESWPLTFGVFIGPAIHTDPASFATNFPTPSDFINPANLNSYRAGLNLNGLIENARMVRKVFDNDVGNARDYCGILCYRHPPLGLYYCDTLYSARSRGDGIPDFKGPVPPPYPKVEFSTAEGEVTIRWFGRETENAFDPISGLQDFEGYRVLMSPNGIDYTIVGSFDKVDWKPYFLNTLQFDTLFTLGTWQPTDTRPLTWDEIQRLYAIRQNPPAMPPDRVGWDTCRNTIDPVTGALTIGHPIDPDRFGTPLQVRFSARWPSLDASYCNPDTFDQAVGIPLTAIRVRFCNFCSHLGRFVDSIFYFARQDYNLGMDKAKMYPAVTDLANDSAYWYQFKMTGLFPSQPVWFAVVPFDNGWATPFQRIEPQEATPYANTYLVYPIASDSARRADSLKVSVYPNPYRIDNDYSYFEKRLPVSGHPQSNKRINFVNLPPKCSIRIYTLDGDLVQQINHDKNPNTSDAGYEFWDLLSRNAQPVVAGLYLYTVESAEGRYVGKIIIIQ